MAARLWGYLVAACVFLLALFGVYVKGRSDASAAANKERLEEKVEQQGKVIEEVQEAHQVREEVEEKIDTSTSAKKRQDLIDRWGEP